MKLLNRAFIALDSFIKGHKKGKIENKTILIVFQQVFGDAVVIQSSLEAYTKLYPRSEGYKVIFVARQPVLNFMKDTLPLPEEMTFEAVDFKRFLEDYSYYREIVRKYRDLAGTIIVPGLGLSGDIFTSSMNAKRKIGVIPTFDLKKPLVMAMFSKFACNERIRPDKEDMKLQCHRKLLNYLGDRDYKARLSELLKQERIIDGRYAVLCPSSSKMEKCWPIERFAEVADYLAGKFGLEIHLCGGSGEEKFAEALTKLSSHPEKIVSHIGKTTFKEWSSIVQHASIVVGNDSATIHIAAAARVPSVCITGVYDKYRFYPYKVDELGSNDILPSAIFKDMPCEYCKSIGYDAGFGNDECKKRISKGLCAACIDLITVDEVKKEIERWADAFPHF